MLVYLGDSELVGAERFRRVIADEAPSMLGYNEARWAALALFRSVRAANCALLRTLPDAAWERAGEHSDEGRLTLADLLRIYAQRAELHAGQIVAIRTRYGPSAPPEENARGMKRDKGRRRGLRRRPQYYDDTGDVTGYRAPA